MVLDWLEPFAPVVCTTGNNDPIVDSRCWTSPSWTCRAGVSAWSIAYGAVFAPWPSCNNFFPRPSKL